MALGQNYSIPSDCPEDNLKPPWEKWGIPKNPNPEISSSPLCATEGEARLADASASIAAILELHKEGKTFFAIDKALGLGNGTSKNVIEATSKNVSVTNFEVPLSSASAVPMASTEDRSETREDARSFIDEQLDALLTN